MKSSRVSYQGTFCQTKINEYKRSENQFTLVFLPTNSEIYTPQTRYEVQVQPEFVPRPVRVLCTYLCNRSHHCGSYTPFFGNHHDYSNVDPDIYKAPTSAQDAARLGYAGYYSMQLWYVLVCCLKEIDSRRATFRYWS